MRALELPSVCVIGAGSSGIAAIKSLHERGIPVQGYEVSDRVGGNWVFGNVNGMSSAYRSLHMNTSRERMQYSDFPISPSYPDYPHHAQIAAYFEAYAERFGLHELIAFRTAVERAEVGEDGTWAVTLDSGEQRRFDALVVANGHHWDPRWPEPPYPGEFDGEQHHSHDYVDHEGLRDRNVLVVGIGNSAMDIAVESSFVARRTLLSSRRGAWVIPKYVFGRPVDQIGAGEMAGRIPWPVRQLIFETLLRVGVGPMESYGLPRPDHRIGEAHPTVSADFLNRIAHGEITYRPGVERLDGDGVRFVDGSREPVDVIFWCTGYKITFPFFHPDFISAPDNDLPLFKRVFKPGIDNLFFIALLQPLGATMPIAEAQGRWVASYLRGEYRLPPIAEMQADIERERRRMAKRYVPSKRHTMEVDFDTYMYELEREVRAGARRAARDGRALPVLPGAWAGSEAG